MQTCKTEAIFRAHLQQIVPLSDEEFRRVMGYFTKRTYKKYQYVIQAGDAGSCEHFVVQGIVKSAYTDHMGREHILQFAMEEWWFSDPNAFNTGTPAVLNVDCIENTETLSISFENKEKMCAEIGKMEYFFRKKYTTGNMALQRRVLVLLSNNAAERYEQFVQQYPSIQKRVSKTLIACYLGVTRETLSRLP